MSGPVVDPIADDIASRRRAQSEFQHPLVVVAGAGTGKTALLVARVAAWCIGPGWGRHSEKNRDRQTVARRVIERVVAITFTDAAAAEMARKIHRAMLALADGNPPVGWDPDPALLPEDPDEIRRRARALAEEGHRLVVSTIHAFCQRVLSTYPLEAGIHPRFQVDADGSRIDALAQEVVEDSLRSLADAPDLEAWERLSEEGVNPQDIVDVLTELVGVGADSEIFAGDPFDSARLGATVGSLQEIVSRCRDVVGERLDGVTGPVSEAARDTLDLLHDRLADPPERLTLDDIASLIDGVGDNVVKKYSAWARHNLGKSERRCLDDVIDGAAPDFGELSAVLLSMADLRPKELDAARTVVAPLLESLQRRRREIGLLTFSDLLRYTERLLANSAGVRREIARGIDHLLVDEFQDTDTVQCGIVESLALADDIEQPSLFIVGDPKQSIYAWRSADLAAYDAFVERVLDAGGRTIDLIRNFRSVTPVLDEVEELVGPVMRKEDGIQPGFQRLEATEERRGARGVDQPPWTTVEHWVTWPRGPKGIAPQGNSDKETTALEAKAIAADIRRLHDEGVISGWGEVAILLRVTTAQNEILKQLRRAGVPYEVASERDYYRQREVVEVAALIRCVLEPTDSLALLTVVRSDVVGVPDAALAPLWGAGFAEAMARIEEPGSTSIESAMAAVRKAATGVRTDLPGGDVLPRWSDVLLDAVETVAELRWSLREDPPDAFVERLRTRWLAEPTAAARFLGRFRRARIDRFLGELESTLISDRVGDAELARFLRLAVEQGKESKVRVPPDLEADAVHVMTIHRAKGLDFGHVYVAQVHKGLRGGGGRSVAELRRVDGVPEYRLFKWATPAFGVAEWRQERKSRAEQVRLLYVATTRAKHRLVVSGGWADPKKAKPPETASDFAHLICRRLAAGSFEDQHERELSRVVDDETHVTTVLPVLLEELESPSAVRSDAGPKPVSKARLRVAEVLAAERSWAGREMERAFFRSASAEAHDRMLREEFEHETPGLQAAAERGFAMELGTALHGIFEKLDLAGRPVEEISRHRDRLVLELARGRDRKVVARRVDDLLGRLASGESIRHLATLADRVVARELPIVMWRDRGGGSGSVVSGVVDLIYTDPDDDRLVVADYKTDAVATDAEITERVERYRPQIETYVEALQAALDLDEPPHRELWFLHADRIERLA